MSRAFPFFPIIINDNQIIVNYNRKKNRSRRVAWREGGRERALLPVSVEAASFAAAAEHAEGGCSAPEAGLLGLSFFFPIIINFNLIKVLSNRSGAPSPNLGPAEGEKNKGAHRRCLEQPAAPQAAGVFLL